MSRSNPINPYNVWALISPATLFGLANLIVMPAWVLLIIMPGWRWTRVAAAYATPALLAVVWALVMLARIEPLGAGFGSIEEFMKMMLDPYLLVGMWLHCLMLDLFLGAWIVRDAQRLGVPHGYVIPCLIVAFVAGPVGLIAYFAVRVSVVRRWPWTQAPERMTSFPPKR
jgi:hypothetical protein